MLFSASLSAIRPERFRFSLRTLFVLSIVFAVGIAVGITESIKLVVLLSLLGVIACLGVALAQFYRPQREHPAKITATLIISGDPATHVGKSIVVGRGSRCDILVPLETVSQEHCRLYFADGEWFIEDLGSLNGTFVNGRRILSRRLVVGDMVMVGECQLAVK